jgi:hypothetical protein
MAEGIKSGTRGTAIFIKIIVGLFAATAMVASSYAFLFFICGMLPALVSSMIDRRASKAASTSIGAFNMAGMLPYLNELLRGNDVSVQAQALLGDIYAWFHIYGAAAAGWIVIWALPQIWAGIFVARAKDRIATLQTEQDKLVEEWGKDVADE